MQKYLLPMWLVKAGFHYSRLTRKGSYPLAASDNMPFSISPMFIFSSGRAGTTLLRNMLVASNQIAIPQEVPVIHKLTRYFLRNGDQDWSTICRHVADIIEATVDFHIWETSLEEAIELASSIPESQRSLARIINIYLHAYAQKKFPDAVMWGDQSPLHTFYYPWIIRVFPKARFLHLLRDGRDVISSFARNFADKLSLQEATDRWLQSIVRAHQLRDSLPPNQFIEIRYEDLVSKPEETLKEISRLLQIDYSDRMLNYWQLDSTVEHKHLDIHKNVGKPVFASSIGKWKQRLEPDQQQYVLRKTSKMLHSLGYDID